VELKANSPRAKGRAEIDQGVPTTAEGGQQPCKVVRRGLGKHKEHEIAKGELRRLRKSRGKIGKSLTVTKTRRGGGLLSTEILATLFGENKATVGSGIW